MAETCAKCEAVKSHLAKEAEIDAMNASGGFVAMICDMMISMLDNPEPWINNESVGTDWIKDRSPPRRGPGRPRKVRADG